MGDTQESNSGNRMDSNNSDCHPSPIFCRLMLPLSAPTGAIKMRSCSITPALKVNLQDVLDGKHMPPLSLTDFEEYLEYTEMNVENLYFVQWLEEYTLLYNKQHADLSAPSCSNGFSASLALSFARAKKTFFEPGSPMAINLHRRPTFKSPHPHPRVLETIDNEVRHHLRRALDRYVQTSAQGNVETLRCVIAMCAGIVMATSSLTPVILQLTRENERKAFRLIAMPVFWLGLTFLIAAINRVCVMVWIFGGERRRTFKLMQPEISGPTSHTTMMPHRFLPSHRDPDDDNKMELGRPPRTRTFDASVYSLGAVLDDTLISHRIAPSAPCAIYSTSSTDSSSGQISSPRLSASYNHVVTFDLPSSLTSSASLGLTLTTRVRDSDPPELDGLILPTIPLAHLSTFDTNTISPTIANDPSPITPFANQSPSLPIARPRPPPRRSKCDRNTAFDKFPTLLLKPNKEIRDDVILRSNCEVLVRSAILAAFISCGVIGVLWSIPDRRLK